MFAGDSWQLNLGDAVAHRAAMANLDKAEMDRKLAADYHLKCANAALSRNNGWAVDWPTVPPATHITAGDAVGFVYAEPGTFPADPPVCDPVPDPGTNVSKAELKAAQPQGVVDVGPQEGTSAYYDLGPNDTMPIGSVVSVRGMTLVKFSWLGMGAKYLRTAGPLP